MPTSSDKADSRGSLASFLGGHTPFQAVPAEELDDLAAGSELVDFAAGVVVADYATRVPDDVWMVRSGQVTLHASTDATTIDTVEPGGIFGYTPLLTGGGVEFVARTSINVRGKSVPLIDHIDFVTGVSGGAIPAAYFGLKRRGMLADFRERFLIQDAEESLRTSVSLGNISRALSGGVNEDTRFRTWLDEHLFEGATFAQLLTERRPRIWINATDIYNGTPFVFGKTNYSSAFYMATGFHGFHVIVGTLFLMVCLLRAYQGDFTPRQHFGFEAAAWYWHFVDVVWLFLFVAVYVWGSAGAPVHGA